MFLLRTSNNWSLGLRWWSIIWCFRLCFKLFSYHLKTNKRLFIGVVHSLSNIWCCFHLSRYNSLSSIKQDNTWMDKGYAECISEVLITFLRLYKLEKFTNFQGISRPKMLKKGHKLKNLCLGYAALACFPSWIGGKSSVLTS